MADAKQLELIRSAPDSWDEWRKTLDENQTEIDFAGADLSGTNLNRKNLRRVNFRGATFVGASLGWANLTGANLNKANLRSVEAGESFFDDADLSEADLQYSNLRYSHFIGAKFNNANLCEADAQVCPFSRADLTQADLKRAVLNHSDFHSANLSGADFTGAKLVFCRFTSISNEQATNLTGTILQDADLSNADFMGVNLQGINFRGANLTEANLSFVDLRGADLRDANLTDANLRQSNLSGAKLSGAKLNNADLMYADLSDADLTGADLSHSNMVRANITNATVDGNNVYGISVWDLQGQFKVQKNLIISSNDGIQFDTDNIKDAQFINLILDNPEIRGVLNTLTSKAVLILGRFTDKDPVIKKERQDVLSTLKAGLRSNGLLPIVFDFERPEDKDFTEMVKTLAGMCYFVIADVTNPKSSPLELQATVPDYQIPFLPIIKMDLEKKDDKGKFIDDGPFAMMQNLQTKYPWILDAVAYKDVDQLTRILAKGLIARAAEKHAELRELKKHRPAVLDAKIFE